MAILVTGGAGYIGSHTCLALLQRGEDVVVIDNLTNSHEKALARVQKLAQKSLTFIQGDVRVPQHLEQAFAHGIDAVLHFAGKKAVGESVEQPLLYYDNNVAGSLQLLNAMARHGCQRIVFSSSATVYGQPQALPIAEDAPLSALNPYGRTKLMVENILRDMRDMQICMLRYFNPVGAHPSGEIGEDPSGVPNNLMPYVMQTAVGRRDEISVFGGDYSTPDGTGVRDYIHVVDVAEGHLAALDKLHTFDTAEAINLGTGRGHSVLEVITAAAAAVGRALPYKVVERRPGDAAAVYADVSKAKRVLGWRAKHDLAAMCKDAWRWQQQNPSGYYA